MYDLLYELKETVVEGYAERARAITERLVSEGVPAQVIFDDAIIKGIQEAGILWDCNRYSVPDVILCADAFNSAVNVIEKQLHPDGNDRRPKVLLGVVEGDVHDLGKNIVSVVLRGAGIHVVDIGVDLPASGFVEAVRREQPEILGIGAYMSSSMLEIPEVVNALTAAGLRNRVKILLGGIQVSQEYTDTIGADAWAPDALAAVNVVKGLLNQLPKND